MQAPCIAAEVPTRPSHAPSIVPQRASLSGKVGACAGFTPPPVPEKVPKCRSCDRRVSASRWTLSRQHTACGALDRSRRSPPRSRSASTMAQRITQYDFSPTHPHLYVLVECMCQAPPGLGGVVLPLGSLGPYTGSREPSRVRPRLLDPTPLRRAVRRDWHVTSRKRRDMPIPSILPTVSRVEASNRHRIQGHATSVTSAPSTEGGPRRR